MFHNPWRILCLLASTTLCRNSPQALLSFLQFDLTPSMDSTDPSAHHCACSIVMHKSAQGLTVLIISNMSCTNIMHQDQRICLQAPPARDDLVPATFNHKRYKGSSQVICNSPNDLKWIPVANGTSTQRTTQDPRPAQVEPQQAFWASHLQPSVWSLWPCRVVMHGENISAIERTYQNDHLSSFVYILVLWQFVGIQIEISATLLQRVWDVAFGSESTEGTRWKLLWRCRCPPVLPKSQLAPHNCTVTTCWTW